MRYGKKAMRRRYGAVSNKKENAEKPEWKFFWKNVNGLGRINRMAAGAALIVLANQNKDKGPNPLLIGFGAYMMFGGFLQWCSLRALFKKPTKRAFLHHYPETAE